MSLVGKQGLPHRADYKKHPTGVIFHLSHLVFGLDYKMEYVLPTQYAQTVTDEDVEEVNNGRSEYTLRMMGELMQHRGNFVRNELIVITAEVAIEWV